MKKPTQRETNPYPYSDSNKRYQTFDYYMKKRFGGKCGKIPLDAGFSCPNIDGKTGHGGCIYCSGGSSGAASGGTLSEQFDAGCAVIQRKWKCERFIPYLQAHTNTYAPVEKLRAVYSEAASLSGAVMLDIATRADCLGSEVIGVLSEASRKIPLIVELGLQSVHDETAGKINRGHTFDDFLDGYSRLRAAGGDILICVHLINGLPGENTDMMLDSARKVAALCPDMVKLHLLHVIRGTALCVDYERGLYTPMEKDEYISVTASQIELFAPEAVIARVSGDAPEGLLAAPMWCRRKTEISNGIDRELFDRNTFQGAKFDNGDAFCY